MPGLLPGGLAMFPGVPMRGLGPPIIARVPGDEPLGPPPPTGEAIDPLIIVGLVETGGIPMTAPGLSSMPGPTGAPGSPPMGTGPAERVGVEAADMGGEFPD